MKPERIVALLNEALSLEMGSFFIYLQEVACPIFGEDQQPIRDAFDRIATQEREFAGTIVDLIEAQGGHAGQRRFPLEDGQYHYVSASHLLPICVKKIRESVEAFEAITEELKADEDVHAALERIARAKRLHIASIEKFMKKKAPPPAKETAESPA